MLTTILGVFTCLSNCLRIDSGFIQEKSNVLINSDTITVHNCFYLGFNLKSERVVEISQNKLKAVLKKITYSQITSNYDFACMYIYALKTEISDVCFNNISDKHNTQDATGATCIYLYSTNALVNELSLQNTIKEGNHISIQFMKTTGEAKYINQTHSSADGSCRGICERQSSVRLNHIVFYKNNEGVSIYFLENSVNYDVTQIIHVNTSCQNSNQGLIFYLECSYKPIVTNSVSISSGPFIVYPDTNLVGWYTDLQNNNFVDTTNEWPVRFFNPVKPLCHLEIYDLTEKCNMSFLINILFLFQCASNVNFFF